MSVTLSSYHFASAKHTIFHQVCFKFSHQRTHNISSSVLHISKQILTYSAGKILYNQIAPRWWCRRLCVGCAQRFQNGLLFLYTVVDCSIYRYYIFFGNFWDVIFNCNSGCCSIREIFLAGSGIDVEVSTWGHYIAIFKGHMVCLSRMEIYCLPCKLSIRLTFSGFLRARLSTKQPSLYFFFTNGMRVICIIGEEYSIFFYSFRSSVHELCSTCFQISHIACTTQRGACKCVMTWSGKLSM